MTNSTKLTISLERSSQVAIDIRRTSSLVEVSLEFPDEIYTIKKQNIADKNASHCSKDEREHLTNENIFRNEGFLTMNVSNSSTYTSIQEQDKSLITVNNKVNDVSIIDTEVNTDIPSADKKMLNYTTAGNSTADNANTNDYSNGNITPIGHQTSPVDSSTLVAPSTPKRLDEVASKKVNLLGSVSGQKLFNSFLNQRLSSGFENNLLPLMNLQATTSNVRALNCPNHPRLAQSRDLPSKIPKIGNDTSPKLGSRKAMYNGMHIEEHHPDLENQMQNEGAQQTRYFSSQVEESSVKQSGLKSSESKNSMLLSLNNSSLQDFVGDPIHVTKRIKIEASESTSKAPTHLTPSSSQCFTSLPSWTIPKVGLFPYGPTAVGIMPSRIPYGLPRQERGIHGSECSQADGTTPTTNQRLLELNSTVRDGTLPSMDINRTLP